MNPKIILLVEDNPSDIGLTRRALAKSHVANELVVAEEARRSAGRRRGPPIPAYPTGTGLPPLG